MGAPLPELLEALSQMFGTPGAFPRRIFRVTAEAPWPGPKLAAALHRLVEAPHQDLAIAYADHFLYNSWEPVLHLEASVYRDGQLCDEDILQARESLQHSLDAPAPVGRCPDHLASGLEVLAISLRNLGPSPASGKEAALRTLIAHHLLPQVQGLQQVGAQRPLHPALEAALEAAEAVLQEILEAVAIGRPSCTS